MSDSIEEGCIRCLSYFGIFRYPLTAREVHRFHPVKAGPGAVSEALQRLEDRGDIFREGSFFLPENDPSWVTGRQRGNKKALELLGKTRRYASVIASFPFVRSVALSGSLSKFHAGENADIDYFIITAAHRLWIARTLLHLFKKMTFLTGHQHYFCMNFFIDTEALSLGQRNLYSAIEMATLLPVYDKELAGRFEKANDWVRDYLPNHPGINNFDYLLRRKKQPVKRFFEGFLNLLFPERLNEFLMDVTDRRWRRKWRPHGYSEEDYNRAFQTELHLSRNHPDDYEKKVLASIRGGELKKRTP